MGKAIPDRVKKRLQIQTLLKLHWSVSEISKEVSCSPTTVMLWKNRFEKGHSKQDRSRTGRPAKLSPSLRDQFKRHVAYHRSQSTRKAAEWLRSKGVSVSHVTVERSLLGSGLYPYHRRMQPLLDEAHRTARVTLQEVPRL